MLIQSRYSVIRSLIRAGDVIGFSGRGPISWSIRKLAGIPTHLALVATPIDTTSHKRVELLESTSLKLPGKKRVIGVQRTYLSQRLQGYKGEVWWFPLGSWTHETVTQSSVEHVIAKYEGISYDFWQVFREGWSKFLPHLFPVGESSKHLYCSELVAFVLKDLGVLPEEINPSTVSPNELIRMEIFNGRYYQLKGRAKAVPGYNTLGILTEKVK